MTPSVSTHCPYIGLRPYREEESLYFKGRDSHILEILEMIKQDNFIMMTGASGDGKTSLVKAGVIPALKAGLINTQFNNWIVASFRPERNPLGNFAKSLSNALGYQTPESVESLMGYGFSSLCNLYKNSPFYVDEKSDSFLSLTPEEKKKKQHQAANLLIFTDQFEEFFTNVENYTEGIPSVNSQTVINLLLETKKLAKDEKLPIYILCTMRSDYMGSCAAFPGLPELIHRNHYFVPRLKRNELMKAIKEPCLLTGYSITDRLVERLIFDLKECIEILPVLQHVLYQIWHIASLENVPMDLIHYAMAGGMPKVELPQEDQVTFKNWFAKLPEYKRLLFENPSIGNVLDAHASELFEIAHKRTSTQAPVGEQLSKHIIRVAFTCLTRMDNGKAVRNRVTIKNIAEMVDLPGVDHRTIGRVLNNFREQGNTFIQPFIYDLDQTIVEVSLKEELVKPDIILDITHEALIRNWSLLRDWVDKEQESVKIYIDLENQLDRWVKNSKKKEYLLGEGTLEYFYQWFQNQNPNAGWIKRYMLESRIKLSKEKEKSGENTELTSTNGNHSTPDLTNTLNNKEEQDRMKSKLARLRLQNIREFLSHSRKNISFKKNFTRSTILLISFLLVLSIIGFINANKERTNAIESNKVSRSNELSYRSFLTVNNDPTMAFRLAEAAYNVYPGTYAKQAVMESFMNPPFYKLISGHSHYVTSGMFSTDGRYLVTASNDKSVRLWDIFGKPQAVMMHDDIVKSVQFSPDNKKVLSCSADRTIRLWDLKGNEVQKLTAHNGVINSAQFSPAGNFIISTSDDSTAIIWNIIKPLRILKGHKGPVLSASFSPNARQIVTTSSDNNLMLWTFDGVLLKTLEGHTAPVLGATFSNDGKYILSYSVDFTAKLWGMKGNLVADLKGHTAPLTGAIFSPDGSKIFTYSDDFSGILWDFSDKPGNVYVQLLNFFQGHNGKIVSASFATDGETIATASEDNTCRIWSQNGNTLHILKANDLFMLALFTPNSQRVLTTHNSGAIRIWDLTQKETRVLRNHVEYVWDVTVSQSGKYIVTSSWDNNACLWNNAGELLKTLVGHTDKVYYSLITPDEQFIITTSYDKTIRLWKMDGQCLQTLSGHTGNIYQPHITDDGKFLITPSADKTAIVWQFIKEGDTKLLKKYATLRGHIGRIRVARFSNDGRFILTASGDNTARLWDRDGNLVRKLTGHTAEVYTCCFSKDGAYIITGSSDGTARIYDGMGNFLQILAGHSEGISDVVFMQNQKYIVTVSSDRTGIIWNLLGKDIAHLTGHTDLINTV
ncbi:MAG: hypothetical protein A3H98_03835, partial [Bacteroidetes bacterium RIFCSPLOWO2_02_FULL_36_8]